MKVIASGFPKTGTKSLHAALELLGFSVYDYPEHAYIHYESWKKILNEGGTVEDFKRMYENVDAVCDQPACYFWEEIHQAFPNAKIILMTRDENEWYKSMYNQIRNYDSDIMSTLLLFSPTYNRMNRVFDASMRVIFGIPQRTVLKPRLVLNEMIMKLKYRGHVVNVLSNAPRDKLLVFDVNEGWAPLCKFLDCSIPDCPYPRKNVGATFLADAVAKDKIFIKLKREAQVIFVLFCAFLCVCLAILITLFS